MRLTNTPVTWLAGCRMRSTRSAWGVRRLSMQTPQVRIPDGILGVFVGRQCRARALAARTLACSYYSGPGYGNCSTIPT